MSLTSRQFQLVQAAAKELETLTIRREEAVLLITQSLEQELKARAITLEEMDTRSRTERFTFIRAVAAHLEKTIHTKFDLPHGKIKDALDRFMESVRDSWKGE